MPSMPILRTPAFSEICSPSPANISGTPAVTAPNRSELRKAWVSRCSMGSGLGPRPALADIVDQGQEQQHEGDQHQHVVLRDADAPGRALRSDQQHGEEEGEADDRDAVEAGEGDE